MDRDLVIKKIESLIVSIIHEEGLGLLDLMLVKEQGRHLLRVILDKGEEPVSISDCTRVSHAIEDVIEVEGVLPDRYSLEVSSPGVNRPLKKREHFERVVGKVIRVKTSIPLDNRRHYKGVLKQVGDQSLVVEIDKKDYEIPLDKIEKANLEYL